MDPLGPQPELKMPAKNGGIYPLTEQDMIILQTIIGNLVTHIKEQEAKCLK